MSPRGSAGRRQPGFTLIELIVAVAVFAVISAMVYAGLYSVLVGGDRALASAERFAEVQRAVAIVERDLSRIAPRPIRNGFGDTEPAVRVDQETVWLTTGAGLNPLDRSRSVFERVGYGLDAENRLIRYRFDALDQPIQAEPDERVLLTGVTDLRLRFNHEGEWLDDWPPLNNPDAPPLPAGIAIRIELEDHGTIERTFALR